MVDDDVEVPAVDVVLADEARLIGLVDRGLKMLALADEFAAHIDDRRVAAHGSARQQAAFDKEVRLVAQDFAVLAGAGLRLVGIDDEVVRALADDLRHERPLQAGGETRTAAPAQP